MTPDLNYALMELALAISSDQSQIKALCLGNAHQGLTGEYLRAPFSSLFAWNLLPVVTQREIRSLTARAIVALGTVLDDESPDVAPAAALIRLAIDRIRPEPQ